MEVRVWSSSELVSEFPNCHQVSDLIVAIENLAKNQGKVVCTVEVNGMILTAEDEARLGGSNISEVKGIKVSLEETQKLVSDTIINLRAGLEAVRSRCLRVAELVRQNPAGPAQFEFSGLMEQTKFLTDALGALKPRLINKFEYVTKWKQAEDCNRATIKELLSAFKTQDFTLVSDVLEYEMHNLMEKWIDVLDTCEFD